MYKFNHLSKKKTRIYTLSRQSRSIHVKVKKLIHYWRSWKSLSLVHSSWGRYICTSNCQCYENSFNIYLSIHNTCAIRITGIFLHNRKKSFFFFLFKLFKYSLYSYQAIIPVCFMSIYRLMDKNQKSFVSFKKFTSFICEKGYKKVKKPKTKFTMLRIPSPFFSFTFFSGGGVI